MCITRQGGGCMNWRCDMLGDDAGAGEGVVDPLDDPRLLTHAHMFAGIAALEFGSW